MSRIDSVKYQSDAGTLETWASTNYFTDVDSYPMRVDFEHIPSDVDERVHAVQIAGRSRATPPSPSALKSAMLLIIGHYEHRKDVLVGIQSAPFAWCQVPDGQIQAQHLLMEPGRLDRKRSASWKGAQPLMHGIRTGTAMSSSSMLGLKSGTRSQGEEEADQRVTVNPKVFTIRQI